MTPDNFAIGLRIFSSRTPFRSYAIEFTSGSSIVVDHPEAVDIRGTLIVHRNTEGTYTIFDGSSVSRFMEQLEVQMELPSNEEIDPQ